MISSPKGFKNPSGHVSIGHTELILRVENLSIMSEMIKT